MILTKLIESLEYEWSLENGFLGLLRAGEFSNNGLARLLGVLDTIDLDDQKIIDRRLVSLLWYMPIFMDWQRERLEENGVDLVKLDSAITEIDNRLEGILGIP